VCVCVSWAALTLFVVPQLVPRPFLGVARGALMGRKKGQNMPHLYEEHLKNFTASKKKDMETEKAGKTENEDGKLCQENTVKPTKMGASCRSRKMFMLRNI